MFTEFFCGIGGLAACLPPASDALSIDINRNALEVHRLNFGHPQSCKTIESLSVSDLAKAPADLWWMSPPCQPYTRQGRQRDMADPRSAGFRNMLHLISEMRPLRIGFENVPDFVGSEGCRLLRQTLEHNRYNFVETVFCPTELGALNRRRRYYLVASLNTSLDRPDRVRDSRAIQLQSDVDQQMFGLPDEWLEKYGDAMHVVTEELLDSGMETTRCFTSAYGRSPLRSGSFLKTTSGIRFFTPLEILWQLGFPMSFELPDWPPEKLWPLTGNSLALPAVRFLLRHLPMDVPQS